MFKIVQTLIFAIVMLQSWSACAFRIVWQRQYRSPYSSQAVSVRQTADGGYVLCGTQWRLGGFQSDILLIRTDGAGGVVWKRTFSLGQVAWGQSVESRGGQGYIAAGTCWGWDNANSDICLLVVDADGNEVRRRTIGGAGKEYGCAIQRTSDRGYAVAGYTTSVGAGGEDVFLVRTDADVNVIWSKAYGGKGSDRGYAVRQDAGSGFVLAGETNSFGAGDYDVFLVKTDRGGNQLWSRTFGTRYGDTGRSVAPTPDSGWVVAGSAWKSGSGYSDIFLVRTDGLGNETWRRAFGGKYDNHGFAVQMTPDGGFVVAGNTWPAGRSGGSDTYLAKVDGGGNRVWAEAVGQGGFSCGYSVLQISDRETVVAGTTASGDPPRDTPYLMKIECNPRE